ncbi:hypothetical protein P9112_011993 [Eukaryota sp. TZLM1-RC]
MFQITHNILFQCLSYAFPSVSSLPLQTLFATIHLQDAHVKTTSGLTSAEHQYFNLIDIDSDKLEKVILSIYGSPLTIHANEAADYLLVAETIGYSRLSSFIRASEHLFSSSCEIIVFDNPLSSSLFRINSNATVVLIYKTTTIYSNFQLLEIFLSNLPEKILDFDFDLEVIDFSQLFEVQEDNFKTFFSLFSGNSVDITFDNCADLFTIASQLNFEDFVSFLKMLINKIEPILDKKVDIKPQQKQSKQSTILLDFFQRCGFELIKCGPHIPIVKFLNQNLEDHVFSTVFKFSTTSKTNNITTTSAKLVSTGKTYGLGIGEFPVLPGIIFTQKLRIVASNGYIRMGIAPRRQIYFDSINIDGDYSIDSAGALFNLTGEHSSFRQRPIILYLWIDRITNVVRLYSTSCNLDTSSPIAELKEDEYYLFFLCAGEVTVSKTK